MNGFIGIKTNWYTKVKKHLHVSKQLNYITYKIRLYTTYITYKQKIEQHCTCVSVNSLS